MPEFDFRQTHSDLRQSRTQPSGDYLIIPTSMTTDFRNTTTMKSLRETESLKMNRKLLKPQVERRRRERMNRSLENLRILLLQGPEQQAASQRRVEKAEILEHTVLFLQTSIAEAKKSKSEKEATDGRQFLDGFSACMQKAARFLQEESESRGLHDSLSSSLYRCLSHPHMSHMPRTSHMTCVKLKHDMRQNCSSQGLQSIRKHVLSHPYRVPLRHTESNTVQRHGNTDNTSRPRSSSQAPVQQRVWRPWP